MMKNHKKVNTFPSFFTVKKPRGRIVMNERGEHVYRPYSIHEDPKRFAMRLPYKED